MKQLIKYITNRFNLILSNLEKYNSIPEQEMLHIIRVELKKIKAIFNLINFCYQNFNASKEFKPLKEIFRTAGAIREVYLTKKLFLEYKIKFESEAVNDKTENELISGFIKNIPRYKKIVLKSFKNLEMHSGKVDSACLRIYLNLKKSELQKQIYPEINESNLHEERKIIKEIIYLTGISDRGRKNINPLYDEIQNTIGKWHDKHVLIKFLEEHFTDLHNNDIERMKSKCLVDVKNIKLMISKLYMSEIK